MIRYVTPYALDGNLAEAMNFEISISPKGSYVAFVDRDTIWLDPKFGHKINLMIDTYGKAFYTCTTNRTNCDWQRVSATGNDIEAHVKVAEEEMVKWNGLIDDHTHSQLWSGHLMICPVDLWTPLTTKGLLGVDNEIHQRARDNGHKILLMAGVYMYHWYSNFDGTGGNKKRDRSHLL